MKFYSTVHLDDSTKCTSQRTKKLQPPLPAHPFLVDATTACFIKTNCVGLYKSSQVCHLFCHWSCDQLYQFFYTLRPIYVLFVCFLSGTLNEAC